MIRVTYLKGKNIGRSKAFTTNPFTQIIFLSILFIVSARFSHNLSTSSIFSFMGFAVFLAFPAVAHYLANAARAFFAARSGLQSEIAMNDFFKARSYSKNF